jgi:hypothetical protein
MGEPGPARRVGAGERDLVLHRQIGSMLSSQQIYCTILTSQVTEEESSTIS